MCFPSHTGFPQAFCGKLANRGRDHEDAGGSSVGGSARGKDIVNMAPPLGARDALIQP